MSINGQQEHQDFSNLIFNLGVSEHFPNTQSFLIQNKFQTFTVCLKTKKKKIVFLFYVTLSLRHFLEDLLKTEVMT